LLNRELSHDVTWLLNSFSLDLTSAIISEHDLSFQHTNFFICKQSLFENRGRRYLCVVVSVSRCFVSQATTAGGHGSVRSNPWALGKVPLRRGIPPVATLWVGYRLHDAKKTSNFYPKGNRFWILRRVQNDTPLGPLSRGEWTRRILRQAQDERCARRGHVATCPYEEESHPSLRFGWATGTINLR
jgi:hypothetical protein